MNANSSVVSSNKEARAFAMFFTAFHLYMIRDYPYLDFLRTNFNLPSYVPNFFYNIYIVNFFFVVLILFDIPKLNVYLQKIVGYLMLTLSLLVTIFLDLEGEIPPQLHNRIIITLFICYRFLRMASINNRGKN